MPAEMQAAIGSIIGIVVLVVVVLIVVDVANTPAPTNPPGGGTCTLVHRIILPDTCVCSTAGGHCSWTTTRPYLIFFTQAASCPTLGCDIDLR
jgi:hypothetical protein